MICVSICEKDIQKCLAIIEKTEISEIRLDMTEFGDDEIEKVFSCRKRLIATCRPIKYSPERQMEILKKAIQCGATYVDIEYEAPDEYKQELIDYAHHHECYVIISYHNYEMTPEVEELEQIMKNCFAQGCDVAKIVTLVRVNRDNSKLLSLYKSPGRLIAFGMGDLGKITRIVAPFLGAEFTYAAMDEGEPTAPGQIRYTRLKDFIGSIQQI
ncbi:MAG: type I 3-dehydroquinate dehydratase [Bacteroidales bacterium]|nr:type I 3-dehydroquinate dehydratase [Bacteroidales bacterium]